MSFLCAAQITNLTFTPDEKKTLKIKEFLYVLVPSETRTVPWLISIYGHCDEAASNLLTFLLTKCQRGSGAPCVTFPTQTWRRAIVHKTKKGASQTRLELAESAAKFPTGITAERTQDCARENRTNSRNRATSRCGR